MGLESPNPENSAQGPGIVVGLEGQAQLTTCAHSSEKNKTQGVSKTESPGQGELR